MDEPRRSILCVYTMKYRNSHISRIWLLRVLVEFVFFVLFLFEPITQLLNKT